MLVAAVCHAAGLDTYDTDRVWQQLQQQEIPATPGRVVEQIERAIDQVRRPA
jgi:hypothetical protein